MRLTHAALAVALVALTACDDAKKTPADSPNSNQTTGAKAQTGAGEAKAEGKDDASAKKAPSVTKKAFKSAKEQPDEGKKLARSFRGHLNAGRKLVQSKKYAEGIAEFDLALAIDPNDARALSEVGWASFLAGNLDRAERANVASVKYAANDRIKGASLYNLGRVSEQRGDKALARGYYEKSLEARPNKIVQKRLDAMLLADAPAAATPPGLCGFDLVPKKTTAAEVLAHLDQSGEENYLGDPEVLQEIEIGHADFQRAALISYYKEADSMERYVALALEVKGAWHTSDVDVEYNPGAFGIFEELTFAPLEVKDLVPGGAPELIVRLQHDRSDSDMGIDEWEQESRSATYVAGVDAEGTPTLFLYVMTNAFYERDRLGHLEDSEIDEGYSTKGLPIKESSGVEISFDAAKGQVTLTQLEGATPSYKPGTYPIATFPQRCL